MALSARRLVEETLKYPSVASEYLDGLVKVKKTLDMVIGSPSLTEFIEDGGCWVSILTIF